MVPINHMVAVKTQLMQERPNVVRELYDTLRQSKAIGDAGAPPGPDLTPFGIEANRNSLELLLLYARNQGLIPRLYEVNELFQDFNHATRD